MDHAKQLEVEVTKCFVEGEMKIIKAYPLLPRKRKIFFLFPLLLVLTGGLLLIVLYWSVRLRSVIFYSRCNLGLATHFLILHQDGTYEISKRNEVRIRKLSGNSITTLGFVDRHIQYYYDYQKCSFRALEMEVQIFYDLILTRYGAGLTPAEVEHNLKYYGSCIIDVQVPSILKLFLDEILDPIYIIQLIAVIIWLSKNYVPFALIILFLTNVSAALNLLLVRSHLQDLRKISYKNSPHDVIRVIDYSKTPRTVDNEALTVGDVIVVKENMVLPGDCVLLEGKILVNEANVTGEAVPKQKSGIPYMERLYMLDDERHTLYEGSEVMKIEGRGRLHAVIIRSGFYSVRGQFIRDILYRRSDKVLTLRKQFLLYMGIMFLIAMCGNLTLLPLLLANNEDPKKIATNIFDIITTTMSPILPCCNMISLFLSMQKLKRKIISCSSPYRLVTAGSVDTLCLDKTGTLTEHDMELIGVKAANYPAFDDTFTKHKDSFSFARNLKDLAAGDYLRSVYYHLISLLSTCHNISFHDGKIFGDPIDRKMFMFSGAIILKATLDEEKALGMKYIFAVSNKEFGALGILEEVKLYIIKIFEFSSEQQSMAVILYNPKVEKYFYYIKGSPERLRLVCNPETVPIIFDSTITSLAKDGYVLLAMGFKELAMKELFQIQLIDRKEIEVDIIFLGLLIYENTLKEETISAIEKLSSAGLDLKIITGDLSSTACAVALKCGVIRDLTNTLLVDIKPDPFNPRNPKMVLKENILRLNTLAGSIEGVEEEEKKVAGFSKTKLSFSINVYAGSNPQLEIPIFEQTEKLTNDHLEKVMHQSRLSTKKAKILKRPTVRADFLTAFFSHDLVKQRSREIIMTGAAFRYFFDPSFYEPGSLSFAKIRLLSELISRVKIFARMLPSQKSHLIRRLQETKVVAMVGDGLNDCGALKQADIGLAIGATEASLSAVFYSSRGGIDSFIELLREGRATVCKLKHAFKFVSFCSLLQFSNQSLLYIFQTGFTNSQFFCQDLFIVTLLTLASSVTVEEEKLAGEIPSFDMRSPETVLSLLGSSSIQLAIQIGVVNWTRRSSFYKKCTVNLEDAIYTEYGYNPFCQEAVSTYFYSIIIGINYVLLSDSFKPHRKALFSNKVFLVVFALLNLYAHLIILVPDTRLSWLELTGDIPIAFRLELLLVSWSTLALIFLYEYFCTNILLRKLKIRVKKRMMKDDLESLKGMELQRK